MFKSAWLYTMLASALGAQIAPRGRVNPFARPSQPPEAARYWHAGNADPIQVARIEAAEVKRARRAKKLDSWSYGELNPAHLRSVYQSGTHVGWTHPKNLNPFYIAK